jgi:hypothetical protein
MNVVARLRHVLARRPWLYWSGVLLVALAAAAVVAAATSRVDDARRAWGQPRRVVVATADLVPGDPLDDATELRTVPSPVAPATALERAAPGAVARQHVGAGEIVVAVDVAARDAPQALIPDGWSAVAVAEAVPTGADLGDAVRAVADGVVLAADGVVVGRSEAAVLVAVPDDAAPAVATAAAAGDLALLLVP